MGNRSTHLLSINSVHTDICLVVNAFNGNKAVARFYQNRACSYQGKSIYGTFLCK